MTINPRFLIIPALVATLQGASAGDLTGSISLTGTPPEPKTNDHISSNADCSKFHPEPVKVSFYEVGPKKELGDVVVIIKNINAKSTGASAAPLLLDQKGCEYSPYVSAVQTSQKIEVKNSDPILHNVHDTPTVDGNKEKNLAQMGGSANLTFTFPNPENFLRFKCEVHDWMVCYVTVVDHPYFAVSGKDGKYTVEATHRKANGGKPVSKEIEVKADGAVLDFSMEVPAPK